MKKIQLLGMFVCVCAAATAQKLDLKETWVSGYARSVMYTDFYENGFEEDTTTAARLMSGHTLVDLAVNLKPSNKVFIHGMVRIRNDHGGFWGSGVSLDVRNLYLRGLIGNSFRYQIGDINYKLTPYTLFNTEEELAELEPQAFHIMREMNQYDLFYDGQNSWRQQGITGEFGLRFKKLIQEIDFTLFTTRLNASFTNGQHDRLQSGGSVFLKQSKYVDARLTYIEAYDILGTSASENRYSNPVVTGGVGLHYSMSNWKFDLESEFGASSEEVKLGEESVSREDFFSDIKIKANLLPRNFTVQVGFQDVGPDFRSIGAQTKRINFEGAPLAFQRYGNTQNIRGIGMLDIIRDASIYNTQLSTQLMKFNPAYGNAQPYGTATPNRRNLSVALSWKDRFQRLSADVELISGQEVLGQGTSNLKQFQTVKGKIGIQLNECLGTKNKWELNPSYWMESTRRSGGESYETIDLNIQSIGIGMTYGFGKGFEVLGAYRMLTSEGNEFNTRRDEVGEIITFEPLQFDLTQDMYALGLRYNFSDNALINFQWTSYAYGDNSNKTEAYDMSDMSLIYRMKF